MVLSLEKDKEDLAGLRIIEFGEDSGRIWTMEDRLKKELEGILNEYWKDTWKRVKKFDWRECGFRVSVGEDGRMRVEGYGWEDIYKDGVIHSASAPMDEIVRKDKSAGR